MRYSSLALLVVGSMATGLAMAQTATTITFTGRVSDQTCSVSVDGKSGSDVTVKLPNVKATDFVGGGAVGTTAFDVKITGCDPASAVEEKYALTFKSNNLTTNGALTNIASSGAGNVAVQLAKNAAGTETINLGNADESVIELTLPAGDTDALQPMAAQYIKVDSNPTAGVTAGPVKASVEYTLSYL